MDLLIATAAVASGASLVTRNARHFGRFLSFAAPLTDSYGGHAQRTRADGSIATWKRSGACV